MEKLNYYGVVKDHSLFFRENGKLVESICIKATGNRAEMIVKILQDLVKDDVKVSTVLY